MILHRVKSLARRVLGQRPRPKILMYHRVADLPCDPWGLAVHPARFAEQLDILARHRTPMSLDEFVTRLRRGRLPADAVAVTFDDGYADTLQHARPALAAAKIPATLFLASAAIGAPRGFWWDELAQLVLQQNEPRSIGVDCPGLEGVDLGLPEKADFDPSWRAWETPRTRRQHAFVLLHRHLKVLDPRDAAGVMSMLRGSLGERSSFEDDRAMTEPEVRTLIADGLIVLGGHTAHHPNLPSLATARQHEEVSMGKAATETLAGRPVIGFAYPYGGMCERSRSVVRECGFQWACTTDAGGPMSQTSDPYALPRLAVADVDGVAFRQALTGHAQ